MSEDIRNPQSEIQNPKLASPQSEIRNREMSDEIRNPKSEIRNREMSDEIRNPKSEIRNSRKGIGGPNTPEGKKRSSMNALKHGLYAKSWQQDQLTIEEEFGIDFDSIHQSVRAHYRPADAIEEQLVDRIARCMWRFALSRGMERRQLDRNPYLSRPGDSYALIMKFERLVDIHLHRAIGTLTRKRELEKCGNELASRSNQA